MSAIYKAAESVLKLTNKIHLLSNNMNISTKKELSKNRISVCLQETELRKINQNLLKEIHLLLINTPFVY